MKTQIPFLGAMAENSRRRIARLAGALYLVTNVTAVFGSFVTSSYVMDGNAGETALRALAEGRLVRLGIASDLLTFAADVGLIVALYVLVRPVHRNLALLAVAWRLVETAVLVVCTLDGLTTLRLLAGGEAFKALAMESIAAHASGYNVGLMFLGLGSGVFSYLFYRGRSIPRALAGFGIFASALTAACTFGFVVFPEIEPRLEPACFMPIFAFELAIGFWLLVKGVRVSAAVDA